MQDQPSITIRVRPQDVVSIQHEGRTVTVKAVKIWDAFGPPKSIAYEPENRNQTVIGRALRLIQK